MLLAIDVGNTNTVCALHDGKDFVADWRCNTESARTADQYFVWLRQLMQHRGLDPADISEVVISNVAPATLFNLRVLCDRYFGCRPLVVGKPECQLPVDVRVDNPAEVGADRLVNTVAVFGPHQPVLLRAECPLPRCYAAGHYRLRATDPSAEGRRRQARPRRAQE